MEGEQQSPRTKEFFKRSDIDTMAKQISQLREGEAEQEKVRVAGLKTAGEIKRDIDKTERAQVVEAEKIRQSMLSGQGLGAKKGSLEAGMSAVPPSQASSAGSAVPPPPSALPVKPPIPPIPPVSSIPPISQIPLTPSIPPIPPISYTPRTAKPLVMPQKQSRETDKPLLGGRIFLKASIIVLLLLIFTNLYFSWKQNFSNEKLVPLFLSLFKKEQFLPTPPISPVPSTPPISPIPPTPSISPIPPSLFAISNVMEITLPSGQTLPVILSQAISSTSSDGYTRLVIRITEQNNAVIGLREFFDGLAIKTPEGLYDRIDNDFTLFLYVQGQTKRLGFTAKVNDSTNIANVMLPWEKTMENDFENLFALLGKNSPALSKIFRTVIYKGTSLRYQTFTRQDFGICYGVFNDYWVFTSSMESLNKTVDKLVL